MTLTAERLRELLDYDPETGVFTWKAAVRGRRVGDVANAFATNGYIVIGVDRRQYRAHRLAWLYAYGDWPDADIDHINGNKADNRIANLRTASRAQNNINRPAPRNNTSGWKGVCWNKYSGKWKAFAKIGQKHRHIGYFDCPAAAALARQVYEDQHFGEYARSQFV